METLRRAFKKAGSSLLLIVLVALAARLGFAVNQVGKIPRELRGTMAFENETGNIAYSLIRFLMVCNTLAAAGAVLGIAVLIGKRNPYTFPAAAYPVVFPWLYYVTHPNLRYRHPIDPVVLLLAALAVAAAWSLLARKRNHDDAPVAKEAAGQGL